ncbi:MAG: 50S ribosomal protein L32 [Candidatus Moranbacteria bacterium CG23_combo_of_CG06-09_8_20_14_all_39_10]|nr:MAG: 50S ribosomal protein L32 [Candidatus Moranbacteria bacterium CG23_combo_of_CG06-09_8_20_14_all_39_10]
MSTQKQRHTKGRRDRARAELKLSPKNLVKCAKCGAQIKPHIVCPKCGFYKGKEVVDTMKKVTKKAAKK